MLEDDLLPVGGPIRISIATAEISHGVLARAVRVHHPDLHAVAGGAGESDLPRVWRPAWVDVADLPPVVARQVPTVSRVGIHRPNLILSGMQASRRRSSVRPRKARGRGGRRSECRGHDDGWNKWHAHVHVPLGRERWPRRPMSDRLKLRAAANRPLTAPIRPPLCRSGQCCRRSAVLTSVDSRTTESADSPGHSSRRLGSRRPSRLEREQ